MRHLWVDSGNDPNYDKARANGITGFFFDMFDPRVSRAYLQDVAGQGYQTGVYMAWNWPQFQGMNGVQMAEAVNAQVGPLITTVSRPKVQFDIEAHDAPLIQSCLQRWRQLRPTHDTSWTLEGMQGGWMSAAFVQAIIAAKIRVVPQSFTGNMSPFAQDMVLRDLIKRGYPEALVTLFYDAAHLSIDWSGWAFTQGRLPPP